MTAAPKQIKQSIKKATTKHGAIYYTTKSKDNIDYIFFPCTIHPDCQNKLNHGIKSKSIDDLILTFEKVKDLYKENGYGGKKVRKDIYKRAAKWLAINGYKRYAGAKHSLPPQFTEIVKEWFQ